MFSLISKKFLHFFIDLVETEDLAWVTCRSKLHVGPIFEAGPKTSCAQAKIRGLLCVHPISVKTVDSLDC